MFGFGYTPSINSTATVVWTRGCTPLMAGDNDTSPNTWPFHPSPHSFFLFCISKINVFSSLHCFSPLASIPVRKTSFLGTWISDWGNQHIVCAKTALCLRYGCHNYKSPKSNNFTVFHCQETCMSNFFLHCTFRLGVSLWFLPGRRFMRTYPCLKIQNFPTNEYYCTSRPLPTRLL